MNSYIKFIYVDQWVESGQTETLCLIDPSHSRGVCRGITRLEIGPLNKLVTGPPGLRESLSSEQEKER